MTLPDRMSSPAPARPAHSADTTAAGTQPPAHEAIIRLEQVSRRFGEFVAVDDISLDIRRGEVFGLIGHNGAGKSTLFKMMLGLLAPSSGRIHIAGEAVDGPAARQVRQRIGYLPENVSLWDNLSGLETLRFLARLKGIDPGECEALLARVGLAHAGKRPVRAYSKGMRQRLGFAQALLGQPQVLFLDEPTTGLDPRAIHFFWETLAELRTQGLTIVLTSHILAELQHRVDRVAVMANGRLQALGSLVALRERFNLPLKVHATLTANASPHAIEQVAASLPSALAGIGCQPLAGSHALRFEVPRPHKMALLRHLLQSPGLFTDVQVEEPSLEDMFFATGGSAPSAAPAVPQPSATTPPSSDTTVDTTAAPTQRASHAPAIASPADTAASAPPAPQETP